METAMVNDDTDNLQSDDRSDRERIEALLRRMRQDFDGPGWLTLPTVAANAMVDAETSRDVLAELADEGAVETDKFEGETVYRWNVKEIPSVDPRA